MKVYLISDYHHVNKVREALELVHRPSRLTINQIDYFNIEEEITPQILSAIRNSDVVVADISNEKPNLYYEIGMAHGLNKPVIIVSQTNNFNRYSLLSSKFFIYNIDTQGVKQLAFFLEEMLDNPNALDELRPANANKSKLLFEAKSDRNIYRNSRLENILKLDNHNKNKELELWLFELLREIPGFEVQSSISFRDREYDFIIWNMNSDSELQRLGNPIPIEVKATKRIDDTIIRAQYSKAKLQGFKSLIIITTAKATPRNYDLLERLKQADGVSILFIDIDDLETIESSEDLFKTILKSYRKFIVS